MTFVKSFDDYTPEPRFDNIGWTLADIYEAPAAAGPFTLLETKALVADANPAEPATRSFTTTLATISVGGWYKIRWRDAGGNVSDTNPIVDLADISWRPSLSDVGKIDMARTRNGVGVNIGTFNIDTQPTADQVNDLIDKAVNDLRPFFGTDIPADLVQSAQDVAAIRTAMYIELSFFGTEIAQNRSPFPEYKALFKEKYPDVVSAIEAEEKGADTTNALALGTMPAFGFPAVETLLDKRM